MSDTINLRLLDNKQIRVDMGGVPLGNANSYRIIAGEQNATEFTIASKPTAYEDYDYYVMCINSLGQKCPLDENDGTEVDGEEGEKLIGDSFVLPLGMAVAGYGYIHIYAKPAEGTAKIIWQSLKIKIWETFDNYKDYVARNVSYKDTFTPSEASIVNGVITDTDTQVRVGLNQPIMYQGEIYYCYECDPDYSTGVKWFYFTINDNEEYKFAIVTLENEVYHFSIELTEDIVSPDEIDRLDAEIEKRLLIENFAGTKPMQELFGKQGVMKYNNELYMYYVSSVDSSAHVQFVFTKFDGTRWAYMTNVSSLAGHTLSEFLTSTYLDNYVKQTTTVNGHALNGNVTVTKGDVGLGNVDNTSDLNKPISTATQQALNNKMDGTEIFAKDLTFTVDSDYVLTIQLLDQYGNAISGASGSVDLPVESVVVDVEYNELTRKIVITLQNGNTTEIPVDDWLQGLQSEITVQNPLSADLVSDTSTVHKFVSTEEKAAWNAKQAALTETQLAAVNSGINAATVEQIGDNASAIAALQDLVEDVIPATATDENPLVTESDLTTGLAAKQDTLTFDNYPTSGSDNPVKSKGIYGQLETKVSKLYLPAADAASTLISTIANKGIYCIKVDGSPVTKYYVGCVRTSTGNYVFEFEEISTGQRYQGNYTSSVPTFAEVLSSTYAAPFALDSDLTAGLATKQDVLTFDNAPTENSNNPVKSGGIYTAIQNAISSVYRFKGSVATYADLPSTGLTAGDVYNVTSTDKNYAWTGIEWDDLGGSLSGLVPTSRTIAGNTLTDDISAQTLTDSLILCNDTTDIDYIMEDE